MKQSRKKTKILILITLLLTISVGYAFVFGNLQINGIANVFKQNWDVYWANPVVTQGSVSQAVPTISVGEDHLPSTKVNFQVNFTEPGQFYEFTVDAVNNGTLDAMIVDIENKVNNTDIDSTPSPLPAYIRYTVTYADGVPIALNHKLKKKNENTPTTVKYKVRVEFLNDVDSSALINNVQTLYFKFGVTYSQANNEAIEKPVWALPTGRTKDNLLIGDEICFTKDTTQCFNFIKYDGNDVVMLAKYNLNVGNNAKGTATNKQDSDVRGYYSGMTIYGNVPFSALNYWALASSYPTDIYDATNYKTAPDFSTTCDSTHCWHTTGYSVAYYVDSYKTILTNLGATIKDARLLTYSEATAASIGCTTSAPLSCPTTGTSAFITNTSFWLGSANDTDFVFVVNSNGQFNSVDYDHNFSIGVRPVIVVSKNKL